MPKKTVPTLVPDLSDDDTAEDVPASILRVQADALTEKTAGEIIGSVEADRSGSSRVAYALMLSVPAARYRYKLLRIEHGLEPYPLELVHGKDTEERIESEQAFIAALGTLFRSPVFLQLIRNLRGLAREGRETSTLTDGEAAILDIFRRFNIGEREWLPAMSLNLSLDKLPPPTRGRAAAAIDSLEQRGYLIVKEDPAGYVLTELGARAVYQ